MAVRTMPELWWMIILMVVLIMAIMAVVMGQMGPRFGKFQSLMDKMNSIAKENLRGIRVVKSFVQEKISMPSSRKYPMNSWTSTSLSAMVLLSCNP